MKRLEKIRIKFREWLQPEYKFMYVDDLPERVKDETIYIIGSTVKPWLLAFKCPCGCHSIIQLNLLKDADPCWKYKINKKKQINVFPSVWRTTGCKSHFIIKNGKIDWVRKNKYYYNVIF